MKDPTDTIKQRAEFRRAAQLRLQRVQAMTRSTLIEHDLLARKPEARTILTAADMLRSFDQWFTLTVYTLLVGQTGAWMQNYLQRAYDHGTRAGAKLVGKEPLTSPFSAQTVGFYQQRAVNDLQGIADDLIKRVDRAVAVALNAPLNKMWTLISAAFNEATQSRLDMLCNTYVVELHNQGRIDQFRLNGIKQVGVDPESVPNITHDALHDAKKTGPGSRVPRSRTPSGRTIRRIRAVSRRIEAMGLVNAQTAEDEKVCKRCQELADDGPYTPDEFLSLFPAHASCRCTAVPVESTGDDFEDQMNAAA